MKRWVLLTIALYIAVLCVFVFPVLYFFSGVRHNSPDKDVFIFYLIYSAVAILVQGALLLIPAAVARERPVRRRSVVVSAVIGSAPFALLIAIPSHVVSRHRNECCAPGLTLLGLSPGVSVALLSFGPGLFFLFAKKVREKRAAAVSGG